MMPLPPGPDEDGDNKPEPAEIVPFPSKKEMERLKHAADAGMTLNDVLRLGGCGCFFVPGIVGIVGLFGWGVTHLLAGW